MLMLVAIKNSAEDRCVQVAMLVAIEDFAGETCIQMYLLSVDADSC